MRTKNTYHPPIKDKKAKKDTTSPAHKGKLKHAVDFIVKEGTPVFAALDGEIIEVKEDSDTGGESREFERDGNYIEIQHKNGEYSEYEHLQKGSSRVKVGERVKAGQLIALSGATGWLAHLGSHLHFMVGTYGKSVKDYKTLEIVWEEEGIRK